jgi:hypothetical protein
LKCRGQGRRGSDVLDAGSISTFEKHFFLLLLLLKELEIVAKDADITFNLELID